MALAGPVGRGSQGYYKVILYIVVFEQILDSVSSQPQGAEALSVGSITVCSGPPIPVSGLFLQCPLRALR